MDVLNKHAPLKRKLISTNHAEHTDKELSQAIMKRSRLRNVYLKHRSEENNEKDNTLPEDEKIAETFNKFFGNIIKNLNIPINSDVLEDVSIIQDPIIAAIEKYKRNPSILKIKKQIRIENYFDFKHIDD